MKKLLFFLTILSFEQSFSQTAFVKRYLFQDQVVGLSACKTNHNGVLIFFGLHPSTGPTLSYLMKCDENGDSLWIKPTLRGADFNSSIIHPALDSGYFLFTSDTVAKIDSSGGREWIFSMRMFYEYLYDMTETSDSNVFLLGVKDSMNIFHPDKQHLYKLNKDGVQLWEKYYYGNYGFSKIRATSDGGAMILGSSRSNNTFMIMKIDSNGDSLWSKSYPGFVGNNSNQLVVFPQDELGLVSTSSNLYRYLMNTDSQGNIQSMDSVCCGDIFIRNLIIGLDSSLLAIGSKSSQAQHDVELLIKKQNPSAFYGQEFGDLSAEYGFYIYQTSDYGYYIIAERDSSQQHEILLLRNSPGHNFVYSVDELNRNHSISLFPNPTNSYLSIDIKDFHGEIEQLKIFNSIGEMVYELNNIYELRSINISALKTGIYFMTIQSDGIIFSNKFVKE